MKELEDLYKYFSILHDATEMFDDYEFKSEETKGFNEGVKFAYENAMKIVKEKIDRTTYEVCKERLV